MTPEHYADDPAAEPAARLYAAFLRAVPSDDDADVSVAWAELPEPAKERWRGAYAFAPTTLDTKAAVAWAKGNPKVAKAVALEIAPLGVRPMLKRLLS